MTRTGKRRVAMVVYNDLLHDARVYKEARTLEGAGYDVAVIGMRAFETPALVGWDGIPVERLGVGNTPSLRIRYARFWRHAARLLVMRRPDAIHAHDLDVLAPCWLASRLLDVPLVYDAHELWTELPSLVGRPAVRGVWSAIARALVPRTDATITVAAGIADLLAGQYGVSPIVLRNLPPRHGAVSPAPLRIRLGIPPETPIAIYQGGLLPGLGIDRAIRAMEHLPDARLVIIGGGPLAGELRSLARTSAAAGRITFLAPVPFAALPPITAAADVGLFLGESAGLNLRLALPNKVFEYIHAGIPCVATDWPETGRVIRGYEVGKLVPPGAPPEEIARAIRDALAERETLAGNARRAAAELVWETDAGGLVALYENLPWRS